MRELIEKIIETQKMNQDVVLATIVGHAGSTPRNSGSKMLVFTDGSIFGTIGGGTVEALVQKRAGEVFARPGAQIMHFDLSGADAAKAGMLCGGEVAVLVEHFSGNKDAGNKSVQIFKDLLAGLEAGRKMAMTTEFRGPDQGLVSVWRGLYPDVPSDAPEAVAKAAKSASQTRLVRGEGGLFLVEPFSPPRTVIIAGAGHVALHTARLASYVGFLTVVMDDRSEFANPVRFPLAEEVLVLKSFEDCLAGLDVDKDSLIVILTRGHLHDKTVLEQALETEAGYVGMIGSTRKREAIYEAMRGEGVSQAALDRVHSPIGISIDAETPEEIAVSIVGELIKARADLSS